MHQPVRSNRKSHNWGFGRQAWPQESDTYSGCALRPRSFVASFHWDRVGYDCRSKYCGTRCWGRKSSGAAVCLIQGLSWGQERLG